MNTHNTQTLVVKTIDIQAKEWFDKVNGNSYFSAQVTINYGVVNEKTIVLPFQYGYEQQYKHASKEALIKAGLIPNISFIELRERGIDVRSNIITDCKKSEVKSYGQK